MTELIQHEPTQDVIAQSVAAKVTNITKKQINATLTLLNEGSTVPFIARYRKEMTGELDEVQIRDIQSIAKRSKELVERKNTVLKAIFEQR
ncbi:Tex-like N-terminal domain-containing protein, partial [Leuconostoc mesenteroides]